MSISNFRHGTWPICLATNSEMPMRRPIAAAFHHAGNIRLLVIALCDALSR